MIQSRPAGLSMWALPRAAWPSADNALSDSIFVHSIALNSSLLLENVSLCWILIYNSLSNFLKIELMVIGHFDSFRSTVYHVGVQQGMHPFTWR